MSASHIPNLNTLRRGGGRGRGRGGIAAEVNSSSRDEIIQNTDNDASTSRLSAVDAGYLDDQFARLLTPIEVQRRLPLMNRGTYTRTEGIDRLVHTFLSSQTGRKQIISLGAGSDTRFFRLKRNRRDLDIVYHEIDFASNVTAKIERLKASSEQIEELTGINFSFTQNQQVAQDYHLHALDLRTLRASAANIPGVEDLPTLLISECCLIYLSPQDADNVLDYFAKIIPSSMAVIIYEPIKPNDAFGRTMVRNLTARGIQLQTLERYADLGSQRERLQTYGFEARAADMDFIWRNWVDEQEKERVDTLEWLDEIEEFTLLAKHYCISWGWKDFVDDHVWRLLPAE